MRVSTYLLATTLCLLPLAAVAAPFDLGFGGVFDDSNSRAYFADRFGQGFFASLAARFKNAGVRNSNNSRNNNSNNSKEVYTPVFAGTTSNNNNNNNKNDSKSKQGSLYRDAVPAPKSMKASDIEPRLKQDDLSYSYNYYYDNNDDSSYYYQDDNSV